MKRKIRHGCCTLCNREVGLTFHHLIPRKLHRRKRFSRQYSREQLNDGIMLCQRCHRGIHKLYSETVLGNQLNTEQALREDEAVCRHVNWVARQKS